jgi:hypothetical protein
MVEVMHTWPRRWVHLLTAFMFTLSWCTAMIRESVTESVIQVMTSGFQLPWLTVLRKMAPQYMPFLEHGTNPLPLIMFFFAIICLMWYPELNVFRAAATCSDDSTASRQ